MSGGSETFPGGTSVTLLDVYDDAAPDGIVGGSPHMHLASTECYIVVGGAGALYTIDAKGYHETELKPGSVVWFTPGTIHRAVNHGGLQVIVLMGNAGLPEAGDAVMTFPREVLADQERYRGAATLQQRATLQERVVDARRRRDLAVDGFVPLRNAVRAGDFHPLYDFYAAAAALVAPRAAEWAEIVRGGPLAQAEGSLRVTDALASAGFSHLENSAVYQAPDVGDERRFGMCGRLRPYDVSGRRM